MSRATAYDPTGTSYETKPRRRGVRLTQRGADRLTALSNVIFAVALIPTVLAFAPPTILTCAATLVALLMLGVVLRHFKLWWGFAWNLACASMWLVMLVQGLLLLG